MKFIIFFEENRVKMLPYIIYQLCAQRSDVLIMESQEYRAHISVETHF